MLLLETDPVFKTLCESEVVAVGSGGVVVDVAFKAEEEVVGLVAVGGASAI